MGGQIESILDSFKDLNYSVDVGANIKRRDKIPTGSLTLDREFEGGYIRGKIIEIFGPNSTGKSALGFTLMAQAKGITAYIDAESAYDSDTAKMYGVDLDKLIVMKPEYLEQGLQMIIDCVERGAEVVVFDSIAGIAPKVELEGTLEDHNVGKKASRMGQLMRRLHNAMDKTGTTVFFVNQIRDSMEAYGNPITTPGGHAVEFHASYRMQVTGVERIPKTEPFIGHYMKITIKKNKFGSPGGKVMVPLLYGTGICREWELVDLALDLGIIKKSGSWFSYDDTQLAQGQLNTVTFIMDNPELFDEIQQRVNEKLKV